MSFNKTEIPDLQVFTPRIFSDERGYFFESYNKSLFLEAGINCDFVQDNQSLSSYGTIRGIHLQKGEAAQAKLVRVIQGEVLDVAVDLRPDSPALGKHFSIILSGENQKQLFIPKGFGHGFSVLSKTALFAYKCDNFYSPSSESGVRFDDKDLNIDWHVPQNKSVVSDKDKTLKNLEAFLAEINQS